MSNLMLHCGAAVVEEDEVYAVETPEPCFRGEKNRMKFHPIPHTLLLETVEKKLEAAGLHVAEQTHALTKEGQRYFGLIRVDDPNVKGDDHGIVIGLRNAHDGSYSAALAMGSYVFVCDNLAFSGEVLVGRKHTKNIAKDLPGLVDLGFNALVEERGIQERRIEAYKAHEITNKDAHDIVVQSLMEGVFPVSYMPRIVNEWREPTHDAFKPRTIWSLFNAYTEVAKPKVVIEETDDGPAPRGVGANLSTLERRTRKLHGFMDCYAGLVFKTAAQVVAEGTEGNEDALVGRDASRVNHNPELN